MTISDEITQLDKEVEMGSFSYCDAGIEDDEDLICFALRYLRANLKDAFCFPSDE
jgi:hypothetical protein